MNKKDEIGAIVLAGFSGLLGYIEATNNEKRLDAIESRLRNTEARVATAKLEEMRSAIETASQLVIAYTKIYEALR